MQRLIPNLLPWRRLQTPSLVVFSEISSMSRKSQRFLWKEGDGDGKKDDAHPKLYNEPARAVFVVDSVGAVFHFCAGDSDMVLRPAKAVHALRHRLGGTSIVRPFGHLEDIFSQYHYTLPEVFVTYYTFADQPYQKTYLGYPNINLLG